jgi:hypothetical protein
MIAFYPIFVYGSLLFAGMIIRHANTGRMGGAVIGIGVAYAGIPLSLAVFAFVFLTVRFQKKVTNRIEEAPTQV